MRQTSFAQATERTKTHRSTLDATASSQGVALAPPTYGIDALDQQPIQRIADVGRHISMPPPQNSTGLPDNLKASMERLSGLAMDDVRVHYNSPKPAQLQASAYTQGAEIHVGPGQERHLSHEAWHVIQQKQRRVKPTQSVQGVAINDDETLEREADVMGASAANSVQRVASKATPVVYSQASAKHYPATKVYQGQWWRRLLGGYGAFVLHNLGRQYDINRRPESYPNEKGRLKAVAETSKGQPGQAAYAMYPPVALFHALMGNIGSSNIGEHYEKDIPHKLTGPDTDEALEDIGRGETRDFWQNQTGLAKVMGGAIDERQRADILKFSRDLRKKGSKT